MDSDPNIAVSQYSDPLEYKNNPVRQVVLDTETTGLRVSDGHRIIVIACIEILSRHKTGNDFLASLDPERKIDLEAQNVHGIRDVDLIGKPRFGVIADKLWEYLSGAELIIHNADFDLEFLDEEFRLSCHTRSIRSVCPVIDTMKLARQLYPSQRSSLDALCRRYSIDLSGRIFHGAKVDALLLVDVYLAMTSGQSLLSLESNVDEQSNRILKLQAALTPHFGPTVIKPTETEIIAHQNKLRAIEILISDNRKKLNKEAASLLSQPPSTDEKKNREVLDRLKQIEYQLSYELIWKDEF